MRIDREHVEQVKKKNDASSKTKSDYVFYFLFFFSTLPFSFVFYFIFAGRTLLSGLTDNRSSIHLIN